MNGLPGGSTDESIDVQMEGSFPRYCGIGNFHTVILIGILTMNLADGRIDGTDDGHNTLQTVFLVTSHDTIYIKTQVFRLLRYYSPAPRNIARSDWATQNITHNMTSSIT